VQLPKNETSATIYARCALEHGDHAEFIQCQAQLLEHYNSGVAGCRVEVMAYKVIHQSLNGNHAALLACLQSISPEVAPC